MNLNFTPKATLVKRVLHSLWLLASFALLGTTTQAQTACSIVVMNCPPPDLTSPVCASKPGAPGAPDSGFVTWTAPKFALDCGTGPDGYNFQMKWDLPENKLAGGCWEFNRVQRTGQNNNGTLNLWKSTGTNPPLFATPFLYFTGPTDFKIELSGQNNFQVKVYMVPIDDQNNPTLVWTINVAGDGVL
ncbi:MAG TPA: hypothetical protein VK907_00935, partial [Phnomibacter sp.]|nr:hypothetical protein [Phnomibacter sp.]